ncbi:RHS repeat-associated core domain protein [Bernardetia litoralis DSM 6794]|uniref:RHS repeat-associated core domain protein n=1 Tax=Bernardetia litoralis (strain ATCC 23117 / DSM 6794 / NBRC 15988 / NCIMB 1366 / Fx l1 / Sio-4) TaxID=880071 RepID=I4AFB0_BERLS|nr:RHS repeat-associated core domain-containing protein [Bernardetia litoralis]AFM02645.1 RHS repeat-associated core domain protein [Bernardetia litoralis DSM 6794]
MQLRDSTDSLLVEKRQKITISATVSWQKLVSELTIEQDGNLTVFIDNQDTEPVYFDNLELRVESDPTLVITQEHHYYPFGMNMSGIERDGELKYQFNGMVEKEQAFGLELYETPFRSYDAQLGRFWQVEPLADIYVGVNMYQYAYNNPVSFNDPSGLSVGDGTGSGNGTPPASPVAAPPGGWGTGSKIGAGGHVWDLGNTRASPYSMGGTPGQGPAVITIVNYGNDPDLAAAVDVLRATFKDKRMGLRIQFNHVTSTVGMSQDAAKGINAVYLFGDTNTHKSQMYSDATFFNPTVLDLKSLKGSRIEVASGWTFSRKYAGSSNSSRGYRTWEDEIKIMRYNNSVGNTAAFATNLMKTQLIDIVGSMTKPQRYALAILHVMGHNAGLDHVNDTSKGITNDEINMIENWESPITTGQGLARRIYDGLVSYDDLVFGTSKSSKVWRSFVKGYFNPYAWNGNLNNSLFLMDSILRNEHLDLFFNFSKHDGR